MTMRRTVSIWAVTNASGSAGALDEYLEHLWMGRHEERVVANGLDHLSTDHVGLDERKPGAPASSDLAEHLHVLGDVGVHRSWTQGT